MWVTLIKYFNKLKLLNVHLVANLKTWSHALKASSGSCGIVIWARPQVDCITFSHNSELSHMIETYSCRKLGNNGLPVCPKRKTKYNRIWWPHSIVSAIPVFSCIVKQVTVISMCLLCVHLPSQQGRCTLDSVLQMKKFKVRFVKGLFSLWITHLILLLVWNELVFSQY